MLSSATYALYIALLASPGGQGRGSGCCMTPGAPSAIWLSTYSQNLAWSSASRSREVGVAAPVPRGGEADHGSCCQLIFKLLDAVGQGPASSGGW